MNQHSAGEWQTAGEFDEEIRAVTGNKLIARIYLVPGDDAAMTETYANARLLRAAPKLLAALKSSDLAWLIDNAIHGDISSDDPSTLERLLRLRTEIMNAWDEVEKQ